MFYSHRAGKNIKEKFAINAIADFPATAGNVSGWQLTLIDVADSLDMIDQKVLHEEDPNTKGIEH